jgi:hypothetical protein
VPEGVGARLDFRMADGAREDAWLRDAARLVVDEVVSGLGAERIRAVVLSGSVARGEGAVLWRDDGRTLPLADLDLYVVAREGAAQEVVDSLREERHALLTRLQRGAIRADVGILTGDDLGRLPPTLGNLAFLTDGRVVWGDGAVLRDARRIDPSEIPREDALNLVLNRAAEELFALRQAGSSREEGAAFGVYYRGVKTVTDVALAVAMTRGERSASYRGRAGALREALAADARLREALPRESLEAVERACSWKISPDWGALSGHVPGSPGYPDEAKRFLALRVALVRGFVRWYVGGEREPLDALAGSERWARAARAWVRYGKRSGQAALVAATRLLTGRVRPSPRLAAQLAALALFLGSEDAESAARARRTAARFLAGARAGEEGTKDAVLAAWGREIMDWRKA